MAFNILDWEIITKAQAEATQYDYGIIVKNFDPSTWTAPVEGTGAFVTKGDLNLNYALNFVNLGSDINGMHFNYKELEVATGVQASTLQVTALGFSAADLAYAIGGATASNGKVSTTLTVDDNSFQNIAWVGHKVDGGWVACVMPYALSTGGLNITATKGEKGSYNLTLTAFRSIENKQQGEMEFYVKDKSTISLTAYTESRTVEEGTATSFIVTATGATGYQWQMCAVGSAVFKDIDSETSSTLAIASADVVTEASGNQYRCKITNSTDTLYSPPAVLTVAEAE
jgi:hypothetical protein